MARHNMLIVSPGSLHMNTGNENIVYTEFIKKKKVEQVTLAVACSASCRQLLLSSGNIYPCDISRDFSGFWC